MISGYARDEADGLVLDFNIDGKLDKSFNKTGSVVLKDQGDIQSVSIGPNGSVTGLMETVDGKAEAVPSPTQALWTEHFLRTESARRCR